MVLRRTDSVSTRMETDASVTVRFVSVDDVRPLRREVLRVGMPDATVEFDGDDEPATFHVAAVDDLASVVAVSSWMHRPLAEDPSASSLQLRGMATRETFQGSGIGGRLLEFGFAHARTIAVRWVWANARDTALNFYVRHGFDVVGDGFIEPVTGLPHHRVRRSI